mgnify:CR=1 FL=1
MYDVVAIGELLVDFACRSTDDDGYPVLAARPPISSRCWPAMG